MRSKQNKRKSNFWVRFSEREPYNLCRSLSVLETFKSMCTIGIAQSGRFLMREYELGSFFPFHEVKSPNSITRHSQVIGSLETRNLIYCLDHKQKWTTGKLLLRIPYEWSSFTKTKALKNSMGSLGRLGERMQKGWHTESQWSWEHYCLDYFDGLV